MLTQSWLGLVSSIARGVVEPMSGPGQSHTCGGGAALHGKDGTRHRGGRLCRRSGQIKAVGATAGYTTTD